jgi:hypothetical protein
MGSNKRVGSVARWLISRAQTPQYWRETFEAYPTSAQTVLDTKAEKTRRG